MLMKLASAMKKDQIIVINISGRGDKDCAAIARVTEGRIFMSNIAKAFDHGKAFIPFITCGDPSLDVTEKLVFEMANAGADLIELGIPFSDPTAEGPVIRDASLRALSGGVTVPKIFEMVKRIRKTVKIPMVFMTYANVVFSCGLKNDSLNTDDSKANPRTGNSEIFISKCSEIGIDGLILPDIPLRKKRNLTVSVKNTASILFHLLLRRPMNAFP